MQKLHAISLWGLPVDIVIYSIITDWGSSTQASSSYCVSCWVVIKAVLSAWALFSAAVGEEYKNLQLSCKVLFRGQFLVSCVLSLELAKHLELTLQKVLISPRAKIRKNIYNCHIQPCKKKRIYTPDVKLHQSRLFIVDHQHSHIL